MTASNTRRLRTATWACFPTFPGGVVSAKGDIYARDGDRCIAAQNGACFFHEPFKKGSQAELSMVGIQWIDGVVVTVAVAQAETDIYHVVAEQLAAIALVQDAIDAADGVFYLHLTARNAFIDQWIAILLPGLPKSWSAGPWRRGSCWHRSKRAETRPRRKCVGCARGSWLRSARRRPATRTSNGRRA